MTSRTRAPATLPPAGLPGLEPSWSRLVSTTDIDGVDRTWHVLDNQVADPELTLLCVHGNPTWSYLWRSLLEAAPPRIRVVAPDHLDMGYSERTGTTRNLARRIDDLGAVVSALDIAGPVVVVAHDWGGPISLGWASRHQSRLAGIVLTNTAVHHPAGSPAPALIRLARSRPVLNTLATRTSGFIYGTLRLARAALSREVRDAYRAPYRSAKRRRAIASFVADIPLEPNHVSMPTLEEIQAGVERLTDVPTLLLWGATDPVFSDRYLNDLRKRFPDADVHRVGQAGHLIAEDMNIAEPIFNWIAGLHSGRPRAVPAGGASLLSSIDRLRGSDKTAVVEMEGSNPGRSMTFAELATEIDVVGTGLAVTGAVKGHRVALLVPPGIDLTVCLYACWRIGAVPVITDAGLGAKGITRALRSAAPDYLIGIERALAAARLLRWPGKRISVAKLSSIRSASLGIEISLPDIRLLGQEATLPDPPAATEPAIIVFTSGATGPAKGVSYLHGQAQAQRDVLRELYGIGEDDRLVAAFAPFALYGPALGISSAVPDMEVTAPATLTAEALAGAAAAIDATIVFASPAALANVDETAAALPERLRSALGRVRLLMSAGAPIAPGLLRRISDLVPEAEIHTPYGMTEVLPVADISLAEIDQVGEGNGVCVGMPVPGVEVAISALDEMGTTSRELTTEPNISGEICIRADHARDRYDKLWETTAAASQPPGWHRSGDVGHLDDAGRVWVEGRLVHVIRTASGVVTPVAVEHNAESVPGIAQAAAVGVGPVGTQQVVVVVTSNPPSRSSGLVDLELADAVRDAVNVDVAAVLQVPALPVDKRHNSKIDRTRVAVWAERVLAGGRVGTP